MVAKAGAVTVLKQKSFRSLGYSEMKRESYSSAVELVIKQSKSGKKTYNSKEKALNIFRRSSSVKFVMILMIARAFKTKLKNKFR